MKKAILKKGYYFEKNTDPVAVENLRKDTYGIKSMVYAYTNYVKAINQIPESENAITA
jgi:hypothetical protein